MNPKSVHIIDIKNTGFRKLGRVKRRPYNVLFTCIGRRVSLLNSFRRAARRLRQPVGFFGTDITAWSPALQCCDQGFLVSSFDHPNYLDQIETLIKACRIDLLVPTVDLDLPLLAAAREQFAKLGCHVLVSSPHVVEICQDKRKTVRSLTKLGFTVPLTVSPRSLLRKAAGSHPTWPCYLKPWDGYAAQGQAMVHNREELRFYSKRIPHAICQEYIRGEEFSCDVYVDRMGKVRCVVPRQRLEVRNGEVSKARIVKDTALMKEVERLVTKLKAGPGMITVQVIITQDNQQVFLEINPRFGGGVPLAIQAGADFPYWLMAEMAGRHPRIQMDGFTDGLLMLRYDDEVWLLDS